MRYGIAFGMAFCVIASIYSNVWWIAGFLLFVAAGCADILMIRSRQRRHLTVRREDNDD